MIRNCQLFGTKICERILRYIIMCTRYMPKLHPEIFEIIEENLGYLNESRSSFAYLNIRNTDMDKNTA